MIGRHPLRALLAAVGSVVAIVLGWVAAMLLGLFVTGPIAAGLTWLLFGVLLVALLCGWSSLYRRPRAAD